MATRMLVRSAACASRCVRTMRTAAAPAFQPTPRVRVSAIRATAVAGFDACVAPPASTVLQATSLGTTRVYSTSRDARSTSGGAAQPPVLHDFVSELQGIAAACEGGVKRPKDCQAVLSQVVPRLRAFAERREEWMKPEFRDVDTEKGYGTHILHCEEDGTLAVVLVTWLPGRDVPPHNHGSWSAVVGLEGSELNTMWERSDPSVNDSKLVMVEEKEFGVGEVVTFEPDRIHSVRNVSTTSKSMSLHVYGWHVPGEPEFWVYPDGDPDRKLDAYQPDPAKQHRW